MESPIEFMFCTIFFHEVKRGEKVLLRKKGENYVLNHFADLYTA